MYLVGDIVQYTPHNKKPVTVEVIEVYDTEPYRPTCVYTVRKPRGAKMWASPEQLKPTENPNWLDFS